MSPPYLPWVYIADIALTFMESSLRAQRQHKTVKQESNKNYYDLNVCHWHYFMKYEFTDNYSFVESKSTLVYKSLTMNFAFVYIVLSVYAFMY